MLPPITYYAPSEITSPRFGYAFARGCHGEVEDDVTYFHHGRDVALFGSPAAWPVLRQATASGVNWYYADHGYLGRGKYYRVTKNAYQHNGTGPGSEQRFRAFGRAIQPWRKNGRHVLICPNSAVYCGLHGFDVQVWLTQLQSTLRRHTNRELRIRWKTQARQRPIQQDLQNAWAAVVYSSAAAIDALIAGVPVFTLAPFAATARMGLSDLARIESPVFPDDREPFLHALAANQWTLQELFTGQAWRELQDQQSRAA